MRDFLLGVLLVLILTALGLGGFGIYSHFTLDSRLEELSEHVDNQSELANNQLTELSDQLDSEMEQLAQQIEELGQQVEELQEHQVLIPYRVFVPPQMKIGNIEKLEQSVKFKVMDAFSMPVLTVSPGQVYEFTAKATVEITDPYFVGEVEFRDVTVIDYEGNIIVDSKPISVAEATIIEIEPMPEENTE